MSLLRLLSAGRSFVGLRESTNQYKLKPLLPQFGSKKNPFRSSAGPDLAQRGKEATEPREAPGVRRVPAPFERMTEQSGESAAMPHTAGALAVSPAETSVDERQSVAPESNPALSNALCQEGGDAQGSAPAQAGPVDSNEAVKETAGRFMGWLKDLPPLPRRRKAPKAATPVSADQMVQVELSLDSVKVVRNDLSESDLEIVRTNTPQSRAVQAQPGIDPAKASRPEPVYPTAARVQTGRELETSRWQRATGRFLGASKL